VSGFATILLSRDEFLDWLGGARTTSTVRPDEVAGRDRQDRQVTLLYEQGSESSHVRPIIAVPIEDMAEFFAFTATYVASSKPFSAFHRVIPLEMADGLANRRPLDAAKVEPFAKLIAGGVLAEHFLRRRSRGEGSFGSALTAAKATLSATLGSAIIAGCEPLVLAWISDQWSSLNRAELAVREPDMATDILAIWRLLFSTIRNETNPSDYHGNPSAKAISTFLRAATEAGVSPNILRDLNPGIRSDISPEKMLVASREDRIRSFNQFVSAMGEQASDGLVEPFMAGLLLAIVGNGSFDMLRSARELAERSPAAIIWFGICAALFEESNVLTTANCLGRRMVRDLRGAGDPFDPPRADLGLFEYRAMMRETDALAQIVAGSADALCVEILPDVVTYVARGSIDRDGRSIEDYNLMAESFREIRFLVDRVARRIDQTGDNRQRELYGGDAKPRRRR
jgi:hypothetical protein